MKRTALILAGFLLFSLALTACSQAVNDTPPEPVPTPSQPAQTSPAENKTAAPEGTASPAPTAAPTASPAPTKEPDKTDVPAQAPAADATPKPAAKMSVSSAGVSKGTLADEYGMRGSQQKGGVPTLSLPITIKNAPEGTVCFAILMRDPDSKPLCGYEWTHWLAANITDEKLAKNASINNADAMVQGQNDFGSTGYGGPTPPDQPHTYKLTVYALDARLELSSGFSKDALKKAMEGHILAEATLSAAYSN